MCECQFEDAAKLELHVDEEHILPPAKVGLLYNI